MGAVGAVSGCCLHTTMQDPPGSSLRRPSRNKTGSSLDEPFMGLIPELGPRVTVAVQKL